MRNFVFAVAVVCGCGAAPQADDEAGFTIIRHPPPAAAVAVQSFEPARPVEGRMVVVHFTLSNYTAATMTGRVRSTISPVASAPVAGTYDWPVNGLAAGQSTTGVIAFVAPAPGHANSLDLFFEDGATHVHQYDATTPFDVAGRYLFTQTLIWAKNPRAHLQDQVHVGWSAFVSSDNDWAQDFYAGSMQAGDEFHGPTPAPRPIDVIPDVENVSVGVVLANLGDGIIDVNRVASDAFAIAAGNWDSSRAAADLTPSPAAASCDGPLIAANRIISGRALLDGVDGASHHYADVIDTDGYSSPSFCGATSHYWYEWEATRTGDTGAAALAITPPLAVLTPGGSAQFAASGGVVDWSVEGGAINGYIDATGRYTPPARSLNNQQVIVHAQLRGTSTVTNAYVTMHPRPVLTTPAPTF